MYIVQSYTDCMHVSAILFIADEEGASNALHISNGEKLCW